MGRSILPQGMRGATAPAPVHSQAMQPKMIVIDSFGRAQVLVSSGSVAAVPSVIRSSDPKVIATSTPATAPLTGPKIIEVNPGSVSQRVAAKVIVVKPSLVSQRRGLSPGAAGSAWPAMRFKTQACRSPARP